ncbi:MAG: peptide-methionine (S)-S-oxide reductase MsrA [Bdellovibrionaceae bacterium]|nr:peptide-methionine (S)-S-oxide reductase MsrA [Pseudobdellovibrionaceae bacterium]
MNPARCEEAILAGGCFWGMEDLIRRLSGVLDTEVGYTGGKKSNPTYSEVKTGTTGHAEAVWISFRPDLLSYESLLYYFFRIHDPTIPNAQGNDVGSQYRSAIFYLNEDQRDTALRVINKVNICGFWPAPVVTEVVPASKFWPAETYHQDYLLKNPFGYTCHFERPFRIE